jgi:hypothetical protein
MTRTAAASLSGLVVLMLGSESAFASAASRPLGPEVLPEPGEHRVVPQHAVARLDDPVVLVREIEKL